jgi:hypothetical protein
LIIGSKISQFMQVGVCTIPSGRVSVQSPTHERDPPLPLPSGVMTSMPLLAPSVMESGREPPACSIFSFSSSEKT